MDEKMVMTYVIVDIYCMILALTIYRSINNDFGNEFEVKSIKRALISFCGFMGFGLVWLLMENGYLPYINANAWISNMLSLWLLIAVSYYWCLFAVSKLKNSRFWSRRIISLLTIPFILSGVLCLVSPLTGWVFTIGADGTYHRGPLFLIMSSLGFVYDIIVVIQSVISGMKEKQTEKKRMCMLIGIYIFFPLAASIIQIYFSGMPILAPAIITGFFLVFVNMQKTQINNDALTGLNNRRNAFRVLEEQIHISGKDHPAEVYMLDVNSFKEINDNFGHVEGDRALNTIGTSLRKLEQMYGVFVARYGGDEFMIISGNQCQTDSEVMINSLREILKEQCAEDGLAYDITVSVGYAQADTPEIEAEQLINQADKMLYKEKHRYHETKEELPVSFE